jgi:hypothetical protein
MEKMSKAEHVGWAMLREMYKHSTPPLDLDKFIASGKGRADAQGSVPWYRQHVISPVEYNKIKEKHMRSSKLSRYEKEHVIPMMLLMWSPNYTNLQPLTEGEHKKKHRIKIWRRKNVLENLCCGANLKH